MALRLIEATLPREECARIPDALQEVPTVQIWTSTAGDQHGMVRVLLEAEHAEAVSDLLARSYASRPGFRLVSIAVEATIPSVEPPDEAPEGPETATKRPGFIRRISREELYEDLSQASRLTPVYFITVVLSTVVAAVGLMEGDIAVVIGAMVIAPLLGPNVGLSLAATLGDLKLAKRSLVAIAVGMTTAAVLSVAMGATLGIDPRTPEIDSRTHVNIQDVILALAAGAAGTLAFTTGVPAVVVGVMVAVALLPPLVVAGLLIGSGEGPRALGALVLMLTNVTCVNLAAVAMFLFQRVRPRTWWEARRARKATLIAVSSWILMLTVLVAVIVFGERFWEGE